MAKTWRQKNIHPQANKSGGYISRSMLVDGNYLVREKINYPTNEDFFKKINSIVKITASMPLKEYDMIQREFRHDARLEIYDKNGNDILFVIPCTSKQLINVHL